MKLVFLTAALALCSTVAGVAGAEPATSERPATSRVPAPQKAFELSVATGYTQGAGNLKGGLGIPSVATGGFGLDLELGYRIDPKWAVLVAGQYQELTAERTTSARGMTSSVAAQYHFRPMFEDDPWVEVGTGYRILWEVPTVGPTLMTHGLEIARARAGLDVRVDKAVALGPVVGADVNLFLFQNVPNLPSSISDPRLSVFFYAGLQGRFDFGQTPERTVATR